MEALLRYFPDLSETQTAQFQQLDALYRDWNAKINVISRKDIDNLYLHHVLHSLAIAKWISFKKHSRVLDLGSGGGFPGIPLAILFPETQFLLVDSVGKKMKVAQAVAEELGLRNVQCQHERVEKLNRRFDFIVTRAVAKLDQLLRWTRNKTREKQQHAWPNGLIALKGSNNATEEVKALPKGEYTEIQALEQYFEEPYFQTKSLVYVQL